MPLQLVQPTSVSEDAFCRWVGSAAPGEKLAYHRGHLALDCEVPPGVAADRTRSQLRRVARRARMAAEMGLVHLVQRRNGPGDFTYIAIARCRPRPFERASTDAPAR
jgi:hypothetical protein